MDNLNYFDEMNDILDVYDIPQNPTGIWSKMIESAISNGVNSTSENIFENKYTPKDIHGMVHCSGGAQTKILHFVDNVHVIKDNLFSVPPLFILIQEQSNTDWKEMYQVFNCGHRMEVYVPIEIAQDIIEISKSFGVDAQIIGRVETLNLDEHQNITKKLTIQSEFGIFEY